MSLFVEREWEDLHKKRFICLALPKGRSLSGSVASL